MYFAYRVREIGDDFMEIDLFEQWMKDRGLLPLTINAYLTYYKIFGGPSNMNQDYANKFVRDHSGSSTARAFVKNYRMFLLTTYANDPLVNLQKIKEVEIIEKAVSRKRKLPKILEPSDVRKIYTGFETDRDRLMFQIQYRCGLRVSELVSIAPTDFNWTRWREEQKTTPHEKLFGYLTIKKGKGDKQRIVLVPGNVMFQLTKFLWNDQGVSNFYAYKPIFGITIRRWQQLLERASVRVGVIPRRKSGEIRPDGENINTHCLRHTFAMEMLELGHSIEQISLMLGHEDISTTLIYARSNIENIRKDREQFTSKGKDSPNSP